MIDLQTAHCLQEVQWPVASHEKLLEVQLILKPLASFAYAASEDELELHQCQHHYQNDLLWHPGPRCK